MANTKTDRAKIFWNGRSQAVRLPKEYRFEGKEVRIRREGDAVILEPVEKPGWPEGFWEEFSKLPPLSEDFEKAVHEPLPESSYRDTVIQEWIDSMNEES